MSMGMAVLAFVVAGCAPGPGPASTDTIDLGSLGRYSEPALNITGSITEQDNPRGPRTATLTIEARDGDGNIVELFNMREDNVNDAVTLPAPGEFPGILAPPHTRQFTISKAAFDPGVSTLFGKVTITELQTGDVTGAANGPIYELTKLRASFVGVYDSYGTVNGYFTIG
jgi:hypothetical protein